MSRSVLSLIDSNQDDCKHQSRIVELKTKQLLQKSKLTNFIIYSFNEYFL